MFFACMICKLVDMLHVFPNSRSMCCSFVILWRMSDAEVLSPHHHHSHQVRGGSSFMLMMMIYIYNDEVSVCLFVCHIFAYFDFKVYVDLICNSSSLSVCLSPNCYFPAS